MTPTIEPESSGETVLGEAVSDLQSDISISGNRIRGTLKYVSGFTGFSGDPELQEGNYLVLSWKNADLTGLTTLKIGLDPSASGTPAPECINDPDKNIVLRIRDNDQRVTVTYGNADKVETRVYSIKDLVLTPKPTNTRKKSTK